MTRNQRIYDELSGEFKESESSRPLVEPDAKPRNPALVMTMDKIAAIKAEGKFKQLPKWIWDHGQKCRWSETVTYPETGRTATYYHSDADVLRIMECREKGGAK